MFAIPARIPTIVPMVSSLLEGFFFFPIRSPPFYDLIITLYSVNINHFGEIYVKNLIPEGDYLTVIRRAEVLPWGRMPHRALGLTLEICGGPQSGGGLSHWTPFLTPFIRSACGSCLAAKGYFD